MHAPVLAPRDVRGRLPQRRRDRRVRAAAVDLVEQVRRVRGRVERLEHGRARPAHHRRAEGAQRLRATARDLDELGRHVRLGHEQRGDVRWRQLQPGAKRLVVRALGIVLRALRHQRAGREGVGASLRWGSCGLGLRGRSHVFDVGTGGSLAPCVGPKKQ